MSETTNTTGAQAAPQDPMERIAGALERIASALCVIARGHQQKPQGGASVPRNLAEAQGKPVSGERYQFTVTRVGKMWKNNPGMFYSGNIIIDSIETPCSLGVSDKLGVRLMVGQTVKVAGVPEKRLYNGEEYISMLANKIEFLDEEQGVDGNADGNTEDIPF